MFFALDQKRLPNTLNINITMCVMYVCVCVCVCEMYVCVCVSVLLRLITGFSCDIQSKAEYPSLKVPLPPKFPPSASLVQMKVYTWKRMQMTHVTHQLDTITNCEST